MEEKNGTRKDNSAALAPLNSLVRFTARILKRCLFVFVS